ncbi:DUF819 family protein [Mariniblastus sp.]|nr:DUF819 family protein [Mariniblastus sp.]MDB4370667.1 DUF819 family protein [Mariniblastus sp.]
MELIVSHRQLNFFLLAITRIVQNPVRDNVARITIILISLFSGLSICGAEVIQDDAPVVASAELEIDEATETVGESKASDAKKSNAVEVEQHDSGPFFKNDAVIFGILMVILGLIFWTSSLEFPAVKLFYKVIPMLLVCYFLPSLLTFFNLVDHHDSQLYYVATRFLLPATLVLLTLSIDLKEIYALGPKALIMFLTGSVGVVVGGPLAVLAVAWIYPEIVGVDGPAAVWRGLSTVAGSWIGGGANQAAMQVVFMTPEPDAGVEVSGQLEDLYSVMVAVDVIVAEVWMFFLLMGVGFSKDIDRIFKADSSSIERLKTKMESFSERVTRVPTTTDLMVIGAIGFGATAFAHFTGAYIAQSVQATITSAQVMVTGPDGNLIMGENPYGFLKDLGLASSFFWLIVISTAIGISLSFTPFRNYEGAGASKIGTVFIFILVAVIGMGMDIRALADHPGFFLIGGIWMAIHVGLMFFVGWLIRAPYFFLAVGSKANIGGAASAPVVAAAFHPALAPVGVLLAVLGYALGTYGAMLCAWMMQSVTPIAN